MMRIIHCADIHLDSKMEANLSKEKAKERNNEILMTFKSMVEYAELNKVDAIIIAGDLFDSKNVSAKTKNIVKDLIFSHNNIDFLYLRGNHDSVCFVDELEYIPDNLKLFSNEWVQYVYGNIAITGIEVNNNPSIYNTLLLDMNKVNLVVMHGQTSKYFSRDLTETINISQLRNKNIDYLALGHIHSYVAEQLDNRGIYCYPGCLEGRGFDECGYKGFVLIDIDGERMAYQFVKFARRKLSTIEVDITGLHTTGQIEEKTDSLLNETNKNDLLKVVLTGEVDIDTELDTDYLCDKYSSQYYFAKIYNRTKLAINYSDFENDISLKGEFIRLVLNSHMSKVEKDQIIMYGIKALSGEELG